MGHGDVLRMLTPLSMQVADIVILHMDVPEETRGKVGSLLSCCSEGTRLLSYHPIEYFGSKCHNQWWRSVDVGPTSWSPAWPFLCYVR